MKYKIVTDSGSNLPTYIIEQYQIDVFAMRFIVDGQEIPCYEKGKELDYSRYYQLLREKKLITTSGINAGEFHQGIKSYFEQGIDIIYVSMSARLSGSHNTGQLVLEQLLLEFPERRALIVDSLSAALGQGMLVIEGCKMQNDGASMQEVVDHLLDLRYKIAINLTVDSLYYFYRGGRVSKAIYLMARTINVKAMLKGNDLGEVAPVGVSFGRKRSLMNLISGVIKKIANPEGQTIYISHGDCIEDASYVAEKLKKALPIKDVVINNLDLVMGSHSGPGSVVCYFIVNSR